MPYFSLWCMWYFRMFNNCLSLWCLSYSINDFHFPCLSACVLNWWCSLISQQLFHGSLILAFILSLSSLSCHVFISVITRFACKQNNWSHGVCVDQGFNLHRPHCRAVRGATVMIILIKVCVIGKCAQTSNNNITSHPKQQPLPQQASTVHLPSSAYKPKQWQSDIGVNIVPSRDSRKQQIGELNGRCNIPHGVLPTPSGFVNNCQCFLISRNGLEGTYRKAFFVCKSGRFCHPRWMGSGDGLRDVREKWGAQKFVSPLSPLLPQLFSPCICELITPLPLPALAHVGNSAPKKLPYYCPPLPTLSCWCVTSISFSFSPLPDSLWVLAGLYSRDVSFPSLALQPSCGSFSILQPRELHLFLEYKILSNFWTFI